MTVYRKEIDGLRALAVLPVLFFHAGFGFFKGGFIGVDVFFVISGYLIIGLIREQLTQGTFCLRQFYIRRARRILPALFFVIFICTFFAWVWMLPSQLEDFSDSIPAVIFFISNIFFWQRSGYFAAEAAEKPLLHTWSLGVEEQFYLLVPLALLLLWRFGRQRAFTVLIIAALASLALCDFGSRYSPTANFFLLPTRAWELFVGGICAFLNKKPQLKNHDAFAWLGLMMILSAITLYDEQLRLPSLFMLLPVGGTALVLRHAIVGTRAAAFLSRPPLVGIGLISYSAYLWHQSLFAFARIRILTEPSTVTMLELILAALFLGALSWWFIERPFRDPFHRRYVNDRRALILAIGSAVLLLAFGVYGDRTQGRFEEWVNHAQPEQARAFTLLTQAKLEDRFYSNGDCIFNMNELTTSMKEKLLRCREKYGPGVAIIGDSHAINLFFTLIVHAGDHRFVAGISQGMCRPHTPLDACYYGQLAALVKEHPALFSDLLYQQAGFHLLMDGRSKEIDRSNISGLAIDTAIPSFAPNRDYIDAVKTYLEGLARYGRVQWIGPYLEPQIRKSVVVRLGCAYPYRLRPNQERVYQQLDEAIRTRLKGSPVRYRSLMEENPFDMAHDFITCDKTYFADEDHYSHDGELRFGERLTLPSLLDRKARHE